MQGAGHYRTQIRRIKCQSLPGTTKTTWENPLRINYGYKQIRDITEEQKLKIQSHEQTSVGM